MSSVMPGRVVAVRCTGVGRGLTRAYAGMHINVCMEQGGGVCVELSVSCVRIARINACMIRHVSQSCIHV